MKKVTLMLIAALMTAVSFAQPAKKTQVVLGNVVTEQTHKPVLAKPMPNVRATAPMPKKAAKKAPRKAVNLSELNLPLDGLALNYQYDYNETDGLFKAPIFAVAYATKVTMEDANHITFNGLIDGGNVDVTVEVNLEDGSFTIPDGTVVATTDYGNVGIFNAEEEDAPITGSISGEGISFDVLWYDMLVDGDYEGYRWSSDYYFYLADIVAPNGTMAFSHSSLESPADVYILQDKFKTYVFNYAGLGIPVVIDMKEDNVFEIQSQLAVESSENGDFYTYGLNATADNLGSSVITGTGTGSVLTFDTGWTFYSAKGYWYGPITETTITRTDDEEFSFPVIQDVAVMPAAPKIVTINPYDIAKEYGSVVIDVPNYDVNEDLIKESKLYYALYAEVAGEVKPVVFIPDLYKYLTEEMTQIPYSFNDGWDFNVSDGNKIVYLNFDFTSWDRIGVQSIYYGGGETNATEIQWVENEKPVIEGDYTFDFNSMEVETSGPRSTAGDITEELTLASGYVKLSISPKDGDGSSNCFWKTGSGPQLRMYSGKLTFIGPEEADITQIIFNVAKWNEGNSADSGEFSEDADGVMVWTGSAQTVVVSIADNTQINSIIVTVGGNGGGEEEYELVVLPAGVEPQAWALDGTYSDGETSENVVLATQVAFDGGDIYVQGLAYYFEDAWLKGTLVDNVATFPSGQFVGEDDYGLEFMIGFDGEEICDIKFAYDPEAKTLTQLTNYIVENADVTDDINFYGYWKNLYLYEGEPIIIDPVTPPADLATKPYLFKTIMVVASEDEDQVKAVGDSAPEEHEIQVLAGFDGDDLYIQGLAEDLPEAWVQATKNADGQYIIPANQYMGTYELLWFTFDYYFTALDDDSNLVDAVFTIDPEIGVISSDQTLAINGSKSALDYYVLYLSANMAEMKEIAAAPMDPSVVEFLCAEDTKYPFVGFDIPAKSVNGETLIKAYLAYQIFVVKDGEEMPLVLTSDLYEKIEEDMSIIPYTYVDNWDILAGGERVYLNQDREEILSWTKIGVKSINYAAGETHESNIVWFDLMPYWEDPDGIVSVGSNGNVRYFDLMGRVANANQKGLLIKQVRQEDGSVKTAKVVRK